MIRRRGFTLIELLAAMLLPALSKAREKARQAVCINNLKQLGLSFMMYAQDYGEYLPPTATWSEILVDNEYVPSGPDDKYKFEHLWCPTGPHYTGCTTDQSKWYVEYGYNYSYLGGTKLSQIRKPSNTILSADTTLGCNRGMVGYYILRNTWTTGWVGDLDARHNRSINVLWVDGHVSSPTLPQLPEKSPAYSSGNNPYLYDPFRNGDVVGDPDNHFDLY